MTERAITSDLPTADVAVPETVALPAEAPDEPIAELPPEPEPGTEGAPPLPAVPMAAGSLDHLTVEAGRRYSKSIYVVHGYYLDVPDVDPETMQQRIDPDTHEPATIQVEKTYERDHYVTELGPNERGNLLVGAGTPVPEDVAALLNK